MRSGIYIKSEKIDDELRSAIIRFAKWLRSRYEFPIRVPVYIMTREQITTRKGEIVAATFFAPYRKTVEPYIKLATGDYGKIRTQRGRDNAIAAILSSLAHEIIHYQQWWRGKPFSEQAAVHGAQRIVRAYANTVTHP